MRSVRLCDGKEAPALGYGVGTVWKRSAATGYNPRLVQSIKLALDKGFRHLDLAERYGTDEEVGTALRQTKIPREELFITSKLLQSISGIKTATQQIVERLGVEYLDLMLIHAPFLPADVTLEQAWRAMEDLVDCGLARSIGVSAFRVEDLHKLLDIARIKLVMNQIELHPYLQQPGLHQFCRSHGIMVCGFGSLTSLTRKTGGPVDSVVESIAVARGISMSQVLLTWSLQKADMVLTTSSQEQRLTEYLAVAAAIANHLSANGKSAPPSTGPGPLSDEEIAKIDAAGEKLTYRGTWQKQLGYEEGSCHS